MVSALLLLELLLLVTHNFIYMNMLYFKYTEIPEKLLNYTINSRGENGSIYLNLP